MEYQIIITNLLDDTAIQPSKFKARNSIEIYDESPGMYNANSGVKFQTSMIASNLCGYSDAYIHVKANITVPKTAAVAAPANNTNKKVIFKNCAPFTICISKIKNTQVDDDQYIDMVMPMYNLEYSDVYSKTSRVLWEYFGDKPALDNYNNNISILFKFKQQITGKTGNGGIKDV